MITKQSLMVDVHGISHICVNVLSLLETMNETIIFPIWFDDLNWRDEFHRMTQLPALFFFNVFLLRENMWSFGQIGLMPVAGERFFLWLRETAFFMPSICGRCFSNQTLEWKYELCWSFITFDRQHSNHWKVPSNWVTRDWFKLFFMLPKIQFA